MLHSMVGVALLAMPQAPLVAHAQTNRSNTDGHNKTPRAQQTILANEWWCAQPEPGRNTSLACRRHKLQQLYAASAESPERTEVRKQLSTLLSGAGEAALSAMRADTKEMLRQFCAIESNAQLEVCSGTAPGAAAGKPARRRMHSKQKRGGGGGSGSKKQAKGGGGGRGRKGMAQLWTPETLQVLRTWWCAERRHGREPRCSRGLRWTRQQPGLSAMRRLFCAKSERGGPHVARLCLGAPGVAPAAVGMSRSERRQALPQLAKNAAALVHGRPRRGLRPSTVNKIMGVLLVFAALFGWMLSRAWARRAAPAAAASEMPRPRAHGSWYFFLFPRRARTGVGSSSVGVGARTVEPARVVAAAAAEELVVGTSGARKRSKRARTVEGGLFVMSGEDHQEHHYATACAGTVYQV